MLVGICGEYFNSDDIRHMYAEDKETIIVELMNGDEYDIHFSEDISSMGIEDYLEMIVEGINMTSGRIR